MNENEKNYSTYRSNSRYYCSSDNLKQHDDSGKQMLSVNQAAEVLGISNVSLYKLIEKDKSFPVVQLGRRKSIPKEQLREWIDKKSKR